MVTLGKISGFFKDISVAYYLGVNSIADAYFVSVYVAGLFYAGITATIPLLIIPNALEKNNFKREREIISSSMSILIITLVLSVLLFCFASRVANFFLGGSSIETIQNAAQFIKIACVTFPLSAITVIATSIRLAKGEKIPANSLAFFNNSIFILAIYFWHQPSNFELALYTTILSWSLMVVCYGKPLLFFLRHSSYVVASFSISKCKRILSLSKIFYFEQISPALSLYFAAKCGQGFASLFSYSNKLFMLYVTMAVVVINSYIVPAFSKKFVDKMQFKSDLNLNLKHLASITFPLVAFSIVNAEFIVRLVFERGEFSVENTMVVTKMFVFLVLAVPCVLAKDILAKIILINHLKVSLSMIYFIGIFVNAAICVFALSKLSILAVVGGYLISMLLVLFLLMFHRELKEDLSESMWLFFIGYGITIILAVVLLTYQIELVDSGINKFLATGFFLVVFYLIVFKKYLDSSNLKAIFQRVI